MSNTISQIIRAEEWRTPGLLTPIRSGPTLVIATDFGGEHQSAHYRSLSFLIADLQSLWYWIERREEIRNNILRDSRRLSYKQLTEDRRARALVPFLRATNTISGLLATFLIDKRIQTFFSEDVGDKLLGQQLADSTQWKRASFEKLLRVAHLGALLISGLSSPGQNVLWVTDQDEIVANLEKHREATNIFGHMMSHYLKHQMGHFRLATTQSDSGSLSLEDLASIPDLVAGSLAEIASVTSLHSGFSRENLIVPLNLSVSKKAHAIVSWLADGPHPLRRLTFIIEHVSPDYFKAHLLRTILERPIPEYN